MYCSAKKIMKCICEKSRYLTSIVDDSVIECDESVLSVISNISIIVYQQM